MNITHARFALFFLTAFGYVVVPALAAARGMAVDYVQIGKMLAVLVPPVAGGIVYTAIRGMVPFRVILETLLCGVLLTVPVGLSTYLAMGANMPLADDVLVRMDEALGFDWRGFIAFVDARPLLAGTLGQAYQSFGLQLMFIPLLLALSGNHLRAYIMVIVYGATCFLSSVVSIWFPALGTYAVYGVPMSSMSNINAYFGYAFLQQFHAVRDNPDFVFSLVDMSGILTFPSVHAAVAVICGWAMWSVRWLRYPFLALNGLMAVSAVSHANHYLVDAVAGVFIAAVVIALASAAFARGATSRPRPELASIPAH